MRACVAPVAIGTAGSVLGGVVLDRLMTVFEPQAHDLDQAELMRAIMAGSPIPPRISAGGANLLGRRLGFTGYSSYRLFAAERFSAFASAAFAGETLQVPDNSAAEFVHDGRSPAILLGGPMSNRLTRRLMGYRLDRTGRPPHGEAIPRISRSGGGLRWHFDLGEDDFGRFDGRSLTALRLSADTGAAERRAIYRLADAETRTATAPRVDPAGWQLEEWLMILRRRVGLSPMLVVAGMHGHSIESFAADLPRNIDQALRRAPPEQDFQMVVPVALRRETQFVDRPRMVGEIAWDDARVAPIGGGDLPRRRARGRSRRPG